MVETRDSGCCDPTHALSLQLALLMPSGDDIVHLDAEQTHGQGGPMEAPAAAVDFL